MEAQYATHLLIKQSEFLANLKAMILLEVFGKKEFSHDHLLLLLVLEHSFVLFFLQV